MNYKHTYSVLNVHIAQKIFMILHTSKTDTLERIQLGLMSLSLNFIVIF